MRNLVIWLAITALFLPNTANIFDFVLHDVVMLVIFLVSIFYIGKVNNLIFLLLCLVYLGCLFLLNEYAFGVAARYIVYSLPVIFFSDSLRLNRQHSYFAFVILTAYIALDAVQRAGLAFNPFMVAYYLSAIDLEIALDEHRYGWFDEHFVASTVLISAAFSFFPRHVSLLYAVTLLYNTSRMFIVGFGYYFLVSRRSLFPFILACFFLFLCLFLGLLYIDFATIDGFTLRVDNWAYHLAKISSFSLFFGLTGSSINDGVPIDNAFIRLFLSLGIFGSSLILLILTKIFLQGDNFERHFMVIIAFASLLNDIISYPPTLAAIASGLLIMRSHRRGRNFAAGH